MNLQNVRAKVENRSGHFLIFVFFLWNDDETGWGLNFNSPPEALQVSAGTY